ncbi:MAG TPA: site-specific integrase [Candidatus Dormibacteraeota bacterium]|nr:site-specific integrase [Candidatus Dormibacteraeota bacterium]
MEPFVEGFRTHLLDAGYTPGSVKNVLKDVGRLGRWMADVGVEASRLDDAAIANHLASLRSRGARHVPGERAMRPLLHYMKSQAVLDAVPPPRTPIDQLVSHYRTWLVDDRGLAESTVLRYEKLARRFLQDRASTNADLLKGLMGADVTAFLVRETGRVGVGSAKGRVAELRSLLRFLHLKGMTPTSLAAAIPPVAGWHDTELPVGLVSSDVQRLLDSCDRDHAVGVRDFAILVLLARLGLRSIEVARLELGDIDWRAGEIVVRGKGRRQDRLPLPCDVGEALATYLSDARPATSIRHVFLMCKAPRRPIRADSVHDVTRRACRRSGLTVVGPHRLRHALATEMLHRGATLTEVSQVLRHRDLATTAIYAKVDVTTLRQVAQPWPGAAR